MSDAPSLPSTTPISAEGAVGAGRSPAQRDRLAATLAALDRAQPSVSKRLRWGFGEEHLSLQGGQLLRRWASNLIAVDLSAARQAELLEAAAAAPAGAPLRLLGVGRGEVLPALLAGAAPLTVWEPDPALLWRLLEEIDLAEHILSGHVRLLLGPDLLRERGRAAVDLVHPLVRLLHGRELEALAAPADARVAIVCAGGLFVDDLCGALAEHGWLPWLIEAVNLPMEELTYAIQQTGAKLVARINTMNLLTDLCQGLGVPLLVWEIDPCLDHILPPRRPAPLSWIFTYREANVRAYRSRGHLHVEHLPLAAPPHRRPLSPAELDEPEHLPKDGKGWACAVSFVGGSLLQNVQRYLDATRALTGQWLARQGKPPEAAAVLLDQLVQIQRQNLDQWRLPQLLDGAMPGLRDYARNEHQGVDPALWLGELIAAERRLSHVAALAPLGVEVWGDAGWRQVADRGVVWRGLAGHKHALTRIYNAARVHVDINRIYQQDIITMRVFDVLACGGFLLAEHSPGLARCFVIGQEIETWRTQAELVAKARHYLAHPAQAAAIAARGRERVLRDHRFSDRVGHMLRRMGLPAAPPPAA
ncbi:MAG: glycosyltransferase [Deltaproteobacteria bacterium]|nr:glycosyltransferase [Deltaproteobacteria bacterium]